MLPLPFDAKTFAATYGGVTTTKYQANFIVLAQGDAADCVFYIQQGKVKLSVVSEQGKEAVIAVLETGDLCGEGCLAVQPLRISTATTMTDCVMVRMEKASVVRAMHDNHAFCDFLMAHLLTQNVRLNDALIDHLFNSSEKRLARALLLLANYGKEVRQEQVIPKIDQQTLAKMIGTTRGRVSHFMNKFRRMGFIEYNGAMPAAPTPSIPLSNTTGNYQNAGCTILYSTAAFGVAIIRNRYWWATTVCGTHVRSGVASKSCCNRVGNARGVGPRRRWLLNLSSACGALIALPEGVKCNLRSSSGPS